MDLIEEARTIQEDIDSTFMYAYQCLQRANIENGISTVELLAYTGRLKIPSRSRHAVSWELKFLM